MDTKSQTINTYNKSAQALADKFNQIGPRVSDIEKAFSYFPNKEGRVLEIGCGNGRDAKEILKHSSQYLGIDISSELVKIARKNTPNGHFEVYDIESYEFPKNIDIIFSFASLLHTDKENMGTILNKAYEALSTGGIFFISLKYADYHQETLTDKFGTRTYYFYTPDLIAGLANKYKVIYQERQHVQGLDWFTIILQK
jgi:SAM-dependent methyltransferase